MVQQGGRRRVGQALGLVLAWTASAQTPQFRAKVSGQVRPYQPQAPISGPVELPGADALADLGDDWARGFQAFHPESRLVFRSGLTKAVLKAFLDGHQPLVLASREMTPEETKAFLARFNYLPMRVPLCLDANIVFVHKSNPLTAISMEQLDAIYSKLRLGGAKAPALVWGDLGLKGEWAKRPIHAYSRAEGTATRASFAEKVLLNGPFRDGIIDRADPAGLAEAIVTDPSGIAYGQMASWYYANKILPLVPYQAEEARFPNQENITEGRYPMPRLYFAYLNRDPERPLAPETRELIHYLLSREGQGAIADAGLMPAPPEFILAALKRLGR